MDHFVSLFHSGILYDWRALGNRREKRSWCYNLPGQCLQTEPFQCPEVHGQEAIFVKYHGGEWPGCGVVASVAWQANCPNCWQLGVSVHWEVENIHSSATHSSTLYHARLPLEGVPSGVSRGSLLTPVSRQMGVLCPIFS